MEGSDLPQWGSATPGNKRPSGDGVARSTQWHAPLAKRALLDLDPIPGTAEATLKFLSALDPSHFATKRERPLLGAAWLDPIPGTADTNLATTNNVLKANPTPEGPPKNPPLRSPPFREILDKAGSL